MKTHRFGIAQAYSYYIIPAFIEDNGRIWVFYDNTLKTLLDKIIEIIKHKNMTKEFLKSRDCFGVVHSKDINIIGDIEITV